MSYVDWLFRASPLVGRQAPQGRAHLQHLSQHDELTKPLRFQSPLTARQEFGLALLDWACFCLAAGCQKHQHSSAATANPSVLLLLLCPHVPGQHKPSLQCGSGHMSPRGQCSCHCFIHRPTHCAPSQAMPLAFVALLPAL